jgi:hypothetical protein
LPRYGGTAAICAFPPGLTSFSCSREIPPAAISANDPEDVDEDVDTEDDDDKVRRCMAGNSFRGAQRPRSGFLLIRSEATEKSVGS